MTIASELQEAAIIEVSSTDPALPNRKLTGTIHSRLKKILTMVTDQEIAASAAVRVQSNDFLTLGEVLRCIPEPDATWTVDVSIKYSMLIM
jgi:flagellar motor switch protein FliM